MSKQEQRAELHETMRENAVTARKEARELAQLKDEATRTARIAVIVARLRALRDGR